MNVWLDKCSFLTKPSYQQLYKNTSNHKSPSGLTSCFAAYFWTLWNNNFDSLGFATTAAHETKRSFSATLCRTFSKCPLLTTRGNSTLIAMWGWYDTATSFCHQKPYRSTFNCAREIQSDKRHHPRVLLLGVIFLRSPEIYCDFSLIANVTSSAKTVANKILRMNHEE